MDVGRNIGAELQTDQAEAETESGWCKIRDAVVIPYAISAVMWVGKYVIERTLMETEKVQ